MTKIVRTAGTAACAFLLANSFAFAQNPIDLGTLGGPTSQATAIDAFGRAAGTADTTGGTTHAFVTNPKDNVLTDIGVLPGGNNSTALGDSLGGVAGFSDVLDPVNGITTHAFFYYEGKLYDLGTLGGSVSQANAVNDLGVVVGASLTTNNLANHAFSYNSKTKALKDLGTLGGTNSAAYGVNDLGFAVGVADTAEVDVNGNPISHAVIWNLNKGTATDIGTLPGNVTSQATAINQLGVVVGSSSDALGVTHPFLYFAGKMIDLGTLGGSYAQPTSVNDFAVVVGFSNTTGDAGSDPFIWTLKGGMKDLNSLLPANSGWTLSSANSIDDLCKIAGVGTINGANHGFVFQVPCEK